MVSTPTDYAAKAREALYTSVGDQPGGWIARFDAALDLALKYSRAAAVYEFAYSNRDLFTEGTLHLLEVKLRATEADIMSEGGDS